MDQGELKLLAVTLPNDLAQDVVEDNEAFRAMQRIAEKTKHRGWLMAVDTMIGPDCMIAFSFTTDMRP